MEIGGGSTISRCMETSLLMGLWPCVKTDYGLNDSGIGKKV